MPLLALLILLSLELEYIETTTEKVLSIKRQIILIAILSHSSIAASHAGKMWRFLFWQHFYTSLSPQQPSISWMENSNSQFQCTLWFLLILLISRMPPLYYMWANCRLLLFLVAFFLSLVSFLTHIIVNSYLYGVYLCDYFFSFPLTFFPYEIWHKA